MTGSRFSYPCIPFRIFPQSSICYQWSPRESAAEST